MIAARSFGRINPSFPVRFTLLLLVAALLDVFWFDVVFFGGHLLADWASYAILGIAGLLMYLLRGETGSPREDRDRVPPLYLIFLGLLFVAGVMRWIPLPSPIPEIVFLVAIAFQIAAILRSGLAHARRKGSSGRDSSS